MKLTKTRLKQIIREELISENKKISKSYAIDPVKGEDGFFLRSIKRNEKLYIERAELKDIIKGMKSFK